MVKRHLKRINAPKTWKIIRRGIKFTTKTNPGGANAQLTMPIANVLKYELKVANTIKEVKHLVSTGEVLINGRKITDYRNPVCFTDAVSLPKANKNFRLIIGTDGILRLISISKEDALLKVIKIIGKTMVKGKVQLNLLDGRNIFFEKHHYKVKDSLLITLPDQLVKEHLTFEKGALVLLYKGKHIGKIGKVQEIKGKSIFVKTKTEEFETSTEYALVVGKEHELVKMYEGK